MTGSVRPLVGRSVRPSVGNTFFFNSENEDFSSYTMYVIRKAQEHHRSVELQEGMSVGPSVYLRIKSKK